MQKDIEDIIINKIYKQSAKIGKLPGQFISSISMNIEDFDYICRKNDKIDTSKGTFIGITIKIGKITRINKKWSAERKFIFKCKKHNTVGYIHKQDGTYSFQNGKLVKEPSYFQK